MPNPEEYDSKKEFLSTCIRELKAEGKNEVAKTFTVDSPA